VTCGISENGLILLDYLQKRGGSHKLRTFQRIWARKIQDLDELLDDLKKRDLILLTRDGRTQVIRLISNAQTTKILREHGRIPPPHHRHPTQI
jgi:hypothetical protein